MLLAIKVKDAVSTPAGLVWEFEELRRFLLLVQVCAVAVASDRLHNVACKLFLVVRYVDVGLRCF